MDHRHLLINLWRNGHHLPNHNHTYSSEASAETSIDSGAFSMGASQATFDTIDVSQRSFIDSLQIPKVLRQRKDHKYSSQLFTNHLFEILISFPVLISLIDSLNINSILAEMLLNFLTVIDESLGEMSLLPTATPTTALTTSTVPNHFPASFSTSISSGLLNSPTAALPMNHTSYLSIPHPYAHLPHFPTNAPLWKLHNEKTLQVDMDVASITETTREVRISEEENDDEEDDDKPLDLSMRHPSPSPSTSSHNLCVSPAIHSPSPSISNDNERPSVIVEMSGFPSVRRSASSVGVSTSSSSVQEHFRRSLSGKWPRRQKTDEKSRASPFPRRASLREHKIIEHSNPSIEEHFRKALPAEAFIKWKQRQSDTDS
ncbi:unnamed protein product, partial [Mesorhabditis belari]|uniref:Uncharacterized protein n=1 Tax=Mesorhabditis belari TaxID=2138241 RepID=A0AAF3EZG1_9BILA